MYVRKLSKTAYYIFLLLSQMVHAEALITDIHTHVAGSSDESSTEGIKAIQPLKDWTFLVYIAADNDLNYFSGKNLDDMAKIGSNNNLNIVAHLDRQGSYEKTKRVYVEKGRIVQVDYGQPSSSQKLDSGSAATLIDFCNWAIKNYPANHYALVLWNHGSGILDNVGGRTIINPSELFIFNPQTNMLEIDRSMGFFDYFQKRQMLDPRAVCFSETYNSFLSNQKLDYALKTIQQGALQGGKFEIIGYDACLMGMLEVANLIRPYANYAVFSQEIELGSGWKYDEVLRPFLTKTLEPAEFAKHIVKAYNNAYQSITYDYTFSAVDLKKVVVLEKAVNDLSALLIRALDYQQNNSLSNTIRACKSKRLCTHFSEPSYIDLDHFLGNLSDNLNYVLLDPTNSQAIKSDLQNAITTARTYLASSVIMHTEGKNLSRARGLSVYFPTRQPDPTYAITPFARGNKWFNIIELTF